MAQPDTAGAGPAIRVRGLTKSYGAQRVLDGLDLDIAKGAMLVVLGPSGSGKTTLLRVVAGLETPDSGEVFLHGRDASALPPQERRLGVVFQEQALFQRMTVEENIAFGLGLRRAPRDEVRKKVSELLDLIRLAEHRKKYPAQLSGGQRQRVAVARALAYRPEAMLFDEPFSALDAVTRAELRREVRTMLRTVGMPALFITHDQEEALELADEIAVLNNGRIEQIGSPFEVYNHPKNEFVATFLGAANVLLGRWHRDGIRMGSLRVKRPESSAVFNERQPVKVVFRPEDVVLNFQMQLLDTPYFLGNAIVDDVSYVGPAERLVVQLIINDLPSSDDSFADVMATFPITITRTKWEASDMELSPGDRVAVGLKDFRVLAHYPLRGESGAKVVG